MFKGQSSKSREFKASNPKDAEAKGTLGNFGNIWELWGELSQRLGSLTGNQSGAQSGNRSGGGEQSPASH